MAAGSNRGKGIGSGDAQAPADYVLSPADMHTVEEVLGMSSGYVLDFSDHTFDQFFQHHFQLDVGAPIYTQSGGSKANRLRAILRSFRPSSQADLLQLLLEYRDGPAREGRVEPLEEKWRMAYEKLIGKLRLADPPEEAQASEVRASAWTGRRTVREQIQVVRAIAPLALGELETLAALVESKRFNDPITADAVQCLRELHSELGNLLEAVEGGGITKKAVALIENNRQKFLRLLSEGAKVAVVAPAMTVGVIHLLALLTGVGIDTQLVGTVYASMLGADALKALAARTSLAAEGKADG